MEVGLYFVFFFVWALVIKNKFVVFIVLASSAPEEIPVCSK